MSIAFLTTGASMSGLGVLAALGRPLLSGAIAVVVVAAGLAYWMLRKRTLTRRRPSHR